MDRTELLGKINEIIEAERGEALSEDQLLIESGMDSFSYAVFWLSLSELGVEIDDAWIDGIDYDGLKVAYIIDYIMEKNHGAH